MKSKVLDLDASDAGEIELKIRFSVSNRARI